MGGGGSGRDRELGIIRQNLEQIYKEILLNSIENFVYILMLQQKKMWWKNVIVMYTCKDNLIPLLYSGKIKKKMLSISMCILEFLGGSVLKDLVSALLWLRSLLWCRFSPLPGNLHMPMCRTPPKREKTTLHYKALRELARTDISILMVTVVTLNLSYPE